MKNNQFGRSMIEMILVMGVIGSLSIAIMQTINNVYSRYKVNAIVGEVRQLHKNIDGYFSMSGYYDELNNYYTEAKMKDVAKLVSEKIVPSDMVAGDNVVHASSGNVTFRPVDHFAGDRKCVAECVEFEIKFAAVPKRECIELAMINWSNNDVSSLVGIKFNEQNFIEWPYKGRLPNKDYLPITYTVAGRMCNKERNDITWWYQ